MMDKTLKQITELLNEYCEKLKLPENVFEEAMNLIKVKKLHRRVVGGAKIAVPLAIYYICNANNIRSITFRQLAAVGAVRRTLLAVAYRSAIRRGLLKQIRVTPQSIVTTLSETNAIPGMLAGVAVELINSLEREWVETKTPEIVAAASILLAKEILEKEGKRDVKLAEITPSKISNILNVHVNSVAKRLRELRKQGYRKIRLEGVINLAGQPPTRKSDKRNI